MSTYQVLVRANNLLLEVDGSIRKMGAYTTRIVTAASAEEAAQAAIALVSRADQLIKKLRNPEGSPPTFVAEKVVPIEDKPQGSTAPGFSFFYE